MYKGGSMAYTGHVRKEPVVATNYSFQYYVDFIADMGGLVTIQGSQVTVRIWGNTGVLDVAKMIAAACAL